MLFARLWYILIKTCWDRIPTFSNFLWHPLVDHQAARRLPDVCLLYLLLSLALPATTESHLVQNWGKQHHVGAYPGTYKSLLLSDDFLMEKIPFVFIDEKCTSYPIVKFTVASDWLFYQLKWPGPQVGWNSFPIKFTIIQTSQSMNSQRIRKTGAWLLAFPRAGNLQLSIYSWPSSWFYNWKDGFSVFSVIFSQCRVSYNNCWLIP